MTVFPYLFLGMFSRPTYEICGSCGLYSSAISRSDSWSIYGVYDPCLAYTSAVSRHWGVKLTFSANYRIWYTSAWKTQIPTRISWILFPPKYIPTPVPYYIMKVKFGDIWYVILLDLFSSIHFVMHFS